MYEVEKNIPVPPSKRGRKTVSKYPWDKLQPGDSFLMRGKPFISARTHASKVGKTRGWKMVTRWDDIAESARVWRIS